MSDRPSSRGMVGIAVLGALLVLALDAQLVPYQRDDAYIVYRYAANIAAGEGVVFNPGGEPVEGFSSPLWLLLTTGVAVIGGPSAVPWGAFIFGVLAHLAIVLLVLRMASREASEPSEAVLAGLVAVGVAAAVPTFFYYASTGLETVAFAALVGASAVAVTQTERRRSLLWALGVAVAWTRPEAPWLVVGVVAMRLGGGPELLDRVGVRRLAFGLLAGLAVLVGVRLLLFGDVLPNTYYAKTPDRVAGLGYVASAVAEPWAIGLLCAAVGGAAVGEPRHRAWLAASGAWMAAAVLEGGDWMVHGRMLAPAWVLAALAATGAARAGGPAVMRALVGVSGTVVVAFGVRAAFAEAERAYATERTLTHEQTVLAEWLQTSGAKSVALVDVGKLGYDAPALELIDLGGLTDATVARFPGAHLEKTIEPGYLVDERRPDFVILRINAPLQDAGGGRFFTEPAFAISETERALMAAPQFAAVYSPLFAFVPPETRTPYYAKLVMVRRGWRPAATAIPLMGNVVVPPAE